MAILVPDDKLNCFVFNGNFLAFHKAGLAFYPGPLLPPRTDGSPLRLKVRIFSSLQIRFKFQIQTFFLVLIRKNNKPAQTGLAFSCQFVVAVSVVIKAAHYMSKL